MTVLLVLGCILLCILLLLLVPIRLRLGYNAGEISGSVHYLFFGYRFFPLKPAKSVGRKPKKQKAEQKPQEETPSKKKKQQRFSELTDLIRPILKSSGHAINQIRRNTVLYKIEVKILVAKPDAHETAIAYAKITSVTSILCNILDELFVLKTPQVEILPDFTRENSVYYIKARMRIQPIVLISASLGTGLAILRKILGTRKAQGKQKRKGGLIHESAASHQ